MKIQFPRVSCHGGCRAGPINYAEASPIMISSRREIVEEPVRAISEDVICVAVGKDVKECLSVLRYALKSSHGKKIFLLHVHVPAQMIPLSKAMFMSNLTFDFACSMSIIKLVFLVQWEPNFQRTHCRKRK